MGLTSLPEDVLLDIASFLSVFDLLSLKQTCRALHAFGSSDYLWHNLADQLELPLDVPPGITIKSLSHDELQQIVIKAIRLEVNWRERTPSAKRITPLVCDTDEPYVDEMQFLLGGKWLLTAQRHRQVERRWHSRIVLWSLEDVQDAYRAATIELPGAYRSSTFELQKGGESVTLAVGMNDGADVIIIYSVDLRDRPEFSYFAPPAPSPLRRISLPGHPRAPNIRPVIHQLAISEGRIAATVVVPGGNCSLQLFVADTRTMFSGWVHPRYFESFSNLWVRLYEGFLLLLGTMHSRLGTMHSRLVLRIYNIPTKRRAGMLQPITDNHSDDEDHRFVDLGPVVAEFEQPLRADSEIHDISRVSVPSASCLSVMIFYSFHDSSSGIGQVTRFRLPPSAREDNGGVSGATSYFPMPPHVSAQLAQVGPGGRAIWLEHNWETQNKRIMRYQPRKGARVGLLIPSDPALPFTPNICHSLAFDEVTGRVCLGLFNGDVYVLDFV
ncbi:uncharacterized protein LAESUDRAFT_764270 [Laetiporus sulphureus 93-53]|uniref:F-box domain-containing protein n=1 Tax=Laetiporus sulphureus 93-53 TaxID=1314785 RepID=A0A165BDN8_9APHY|nr:uncharacterized protein LAESUDRAFT_764270 [Laetiporus sulphureus 93-53]KZT00815.1 hypothetical protein LAESUDRAFT_764270 [Laetiporus sulphureus 93-53]